MRPAFLMMNWAAVKFRECVSCGVDLSDSLPEEGDHAWEISALDKLCDGCMSRARSPIGKWLNIEREKYHTERCQPYFRRELCNEPTCKDGWEIFYDETFGKFYDPPDVEVIAENFFLRWLARELDRNVKVSQR